MTVLFGMDVVPAAVEALRSKAKRLVSRGWLAEPAPGPFTLARSVNGPDGGSCNRRQPGRVPATDRESITPAVGFASRPASRRTLPRSRPGTDITGRPTAHGNRVSRISVGLATPSCQEALPSCPQSAVLTRTTTATYPGSAEPRLSSIWTT